jgi:phosphoglycerate dehydrogenase-like enzyme
MIGGKWMLILSSLLVSEEIQCELRTLYPSVTFSFHENMEKAKKELHKAEILLTFGEDVTADLINRATKLKWIMVASAGLDKMPLTSIKNRDILVTNARGVHKIPMAEYTMAVLLQYAKNTNLLVSYQDVETWYKTPFPINELYGKTIVILGVGAIGERIAKLCNAFEMKVLGVNRGGKENTYIEKVYTIDTMDEAFKEADYIVSVLPSTAETRYIINESHIEVMKSGSVFINIGRGDVVEEELLVKALNEGKIAHAFLDVFETEPLPRNHIFWKMSNVTATPHISSYTRHYLPRCIEIFKHNLGQYMNGTKDFINLIDLDRGY